MDKDNGRCAEEPRDLASDEGFLERKDQEPPADEKELPPPCPEIGQEGQAEQADCQQHDDEMHDVMR